MTTTDKAAKPAIKAKAQFMQFKVKDVHVEVTPDGKDTYTADLLAPFRQGFSIYPTTMFIHGSDLVNAKEIYDYLAARKGQVVTLHTTPRLKKDKDDDGDFKSYWWNITGLQLEIGQPKTAVPVPAKPDTAFRAEGEDEPLFPDEPPKQGQPKDYWAAREAIIGMSWAIDQARQVVLAVKPPDGGFGDVDLSRKVINEFLADVANLAPRFLGMRDTLVEKQKPKGEGRP